MTDADITCGKITVQVDHYVSGNDAWSLVSLFRYDALISHATMISLDPEDIDDAIAALQAARAHMMEATHVQAA